MPNIVKNTTFPFLFDLLAPHSCRGCGHIGVPLCDCCKKNLLAQYQNLCPVCRQSNPTGSCSYCLDLPPIFISGKRDGLLGELIQTYKYHSLRALSRPLAEILDYTLPSTADLHSITKNSHRHAPVVIVPLPTIARHRRERGFDHTLLIAKKLAHLRHYDLNPILTRARNTVQVGSDRSLRLSQALTAYKLIPNAKIDSNTTYILLDDIWTTGASIQAAYSLLQKIGAKHIIIAILAQS